MSIDYEDVDLDGWEDEDEDEDDGQDTAAQVLEDLEAEGLLW